MTAVSFQVFAVDIAVKIIFWVLIPCKTTVRLMLQHPPEPYSIILKTEAENFSETLEDMVILFGVRTHKKYHLRSIFRS